MTLHSIMGTGRALSGETNADRGYVVPRSSFPGSSPTMYGQGCGSGLLAEDNHQTRRPASALCISLSLNLVQPLRDPGAHCALLLGEEVVGQ